MGKSTFLGVFCLLKGAFIWARRWKWLLYCVCQMTNRPQRRFESFVRWQIARRDVLSHLSDDKSFPETFWGECLLHFKKNDDLRASPFWSFCLKGYFYGLPRFARNDGCEVTGLPRWCSQWRVWGHWIATLTLAMTGVRSLDCHASLAMTGMRSLDCHADARNDRFGTSVYKSFFPCSRIKDCICRAKRYG